MAKLIIFIFATCLVLPIQCFADLRHDFNSCKEQPEQTQLICYEALAPQLQKAILGDKDTFSVKDLYAVALIEVYSAKNDEATITKFKLRERVEAYHTAEAMWGEGELEDVYIALRKFFSQLGPDYIGDVKYAERGLKLARATANIDPNGPTAMDAILQASLDNLLRARNVSRPPNGDSTVSVPRASHLTLSALTVDKRQFQTMNDTANIRFTLVDTNQNAQISWSLNCELKILNITSGSEAHIGADNQHATGPSVPSGTYVIAAVGLLNNAWLTTGQTTAKCTIQGSDNQSDVSQEVRFGVGK